MQFNYGKLLGKLKENNLTQRELAKLLKLQSPTLSQKINNKSDFRQEEILRICQILNIPDNEVGKYFFTV